MVTGIFTGRCECGDVRFTIRPDALDLPTETALARRMFVADKGDHCRIADDLPQIDQW